MVKEVSGAVRRTQQLSSKIIIMRKNMSTSIEVSVARETRLWIAVIAVLLLAEVGMHQFGHQVLSLWGLLLAAFLFVAAAMSFRHYRRLGHISWIIVTGLLSFYYRLKYWNSSSRFRPARWCGFNEPFGAWCRWSDPRNSCSWPSIR